MKREPLEYARPPEDSESRRVMALNNRIAIIGTALAVAALLAMCLFFAFGASGSPF